VDGFGVLRHPLFLGRRGPSIRPLEVDGVGDTVKTRYKQRPWLPGNFACADEIIPVKQNLGKFLLIQQDLGNI
jgi:hypothetical protein